jgi:hypothetical protein
MHRFDRVSVWVNRQCARHYAPWCAGVASANHATLTHADAQDYAPRCVILRTMVRNPKTHANLATVRVPANFSSSFALLDCCCSSSAMLWAGKKKRLHRYAAHKVREARASLVDSTPSRNGHGTARQTFAGLRVVRAKARPSPTGPALPAHPGRYAPRASGTCRSVDAGRNPAPSRDAAAARLDPPPLENPGPPTWWPSAGAGRDMG